MALKKVEYTDGETVIEADNLNAMQDSIMALGGGSVGFSKKTYVDGETVITADNLNAMQDAIIALENSGGGTSGGGTGGGNSGSATVSESCESFVIDTGLASIETIIVMRSGIDTSRSGTWGWVKSTVGNMTNHLSYGSTLSWYYGRSLNKITDNGDGTVTVAGYSSDYPILPGTYKWVAYGSK